LRNYIVISLVFVGMLASATALEAKKELALSWNKGIRMQSEDGQFKVKFGGRIMNDWAWFNQSVEHDTTFGNFQDGTEMRRTRLYLSGTLYKNTVFKFQYDWAGSKVSTKDMYVGIKDVPILGTVSIGNQHEPLGLETLTSSKYITFMERSVVSDMTPERNSGIKFKKSLAGGRATCSAGIFRDTGSNGKSVGDGNYAGTARLTGVPWRDDDHGLVHLGVAASYRNPNGPVEFGSKPEAHLAGTSVKTGELAADAVQLIAGELAIVMGSASIQAEGIMSKLDNAPTDDPTFRAAYGSLSYFVTGEKRDYKSSSATFGRTTPLSNLGDGGNGAVELAGRVSYSDLNSGGISGGSMTDITAGINWYLNPNTRFMLNYVRSDVTDIGTADILQTRFQIDF